jgi:hypothetical protein
VSFSEILVRVHKGIITTTAQTSNFMYDTLYGRHVSAISLSHPQASHFFFFFFFYGATARGRTWPPLQYVSKTLDPLLSLSIRLFPSVCSIDTSSSHLVFGLPLRLVAYSFPYIFGGIAVSCILSMGPSHRIRWLLINLTIFSPLIMSSNSSFRQILLILFPLPW